MAVTKDIGIIELIQQYPASANVFAAYGVGCIGCSMAKFETLEQGLSAHGISVDDFLKDLNGALGLE